MSEADIQFIENKRCCNDPQSVWKYFKRSTCGMQAKCNLCKQILKHSGSTSPLHNHLKLKHDINLKELTLQATSSATLSKSSTSSITSSETLPNAEDEIPKKRSKITDYLKTEDRTEIMVSKLAASDGIPFNVFCTSDTLRKLFMKSGKQLPKSPHTIKKMVITHCKELKADLKKDFEKLKSEECKFSVSLDEWTSLQNKRFMNINIHCPKLPNKGFRNLGLVKISGSGTAENCHNILREKLTEYGLSLDDDIICLTTDGATVMTALGKRTSTNHQLCYAHGIQLAVQDVLYKKKKSTDEEQRVNEKIDKSTTGDEDMDSDDTSSDDEEGFIVATGTRGGSGADQCIQDCYKDVINKVRTVVKMFKRSPTKSEVLYNYETEKGKTGFHLILDCKTRWSSLANMISRFIILKDSVLKTLIDLKVKTTFSLAELSQLVEISEALSIVKATVESICEEKANLLTAEIALKFTMQKLANCESQISSDLAEALKIRIAQRRVPELSGTIKYLHDPKSFYDEAEDGTSGYPFENPSNAAIQRKIAHINSVYFGQHIQETIPDKPREAKVSDCVVRVSIKDQLQNEINKLYKPSSSRAASSSSRADLFTTIQVEMALYDQGGQRSKSLERAYNVLLGIPPTSVEAERVFSASGYLCNHLRTKMKPDSLDALSFLRSHYQK